MYTLSKIGLFIAFSIGCFLGMSAGVMAEGIDFMNLTASGVTPSWGPYEDVYRNIGTDSERHKLITVQGSDPYTRRGLKYLPEGEDRVIRLGDWEGKGEGAAITYRFKVDPDSSLFLLKFALVLMATSYHTPEQEPYFLFQIADKEGNLIEDCAQYKVTSLGETPGDHITSYNGVPVRWWDWSSIGVDMGKYAGQEVQVRLQVYDCCLNSHFGYAYFTASCVPARLTLKGCEDDRMTLYAPSGFSSYRWNDGAVSPSVEFQLAGQEMNFNCELTSVSGCHLDLSACIGVEEVLPSEDRIFYDTVSRGESYTKYGYRLPPQEEDGTFRFSMDYPNVNDCSSGYQVILYLTVVEKYYPLEAEICQGEDYVENGFVYLQPLPGIYRDSLVFPRSGCDSVVNLTLKVKLDIGLSGIKGNRYVCRGSVEEYVLPGASDMGKWRWEIPAGVNILDSGEAVRLWFTDEAVSGEIRVSGSNECGTGSTSLFVEVSPDTTKIFDFVCAGKKYRRNGFDLSVPVVAGDYVYTLTRLAFRGCDSVVRLALQVNPSWILEEETEICEGEEYDFRRKILKEAGIYEDTLRTYQGCDSIFRFTLSVNPIWLEEEEETICEGEKCIFRGRELREEGIYTDTLKRQTGCDSIYRLVLGVAPVWLREEKAEFCNGGYYEFRGREVREAGIYTDTLRTSWGCDSIFRLELKEKPSWLFEDEAGICEGNTYEFCGESLTASGKYEKVLTTLSGCDSIYRLDLKVYPAYRDTLEAVICRGERYTAYGFDETEAGRYEISAKTLMGCDSNFILHLQVEDYWQTDIGRSLEDCRKHRYRFYPEEAWIGKYSGYWDFGDGETSSKKEPLHTYSDTGTYRVILTVKSENGCAETKETFVEIPWFSEDFNIIADRTSIDEIHRHVVFSTDFQTGMHYRWDFGDGETGSTYREIHEYTLGDADEYEVYLTVTNADDCPVSRSLRIRVIRPLKIPNTFSPNEDGINDLFMPGYQLLVLDRNGLEVYRGDKGWDGKYKGRQVPEDTYFYKIRIVSEESVYSKSGYITVIR